MHVVQSSWRKGEGKEMVQPDCLAFAFTTSNAMRYLSLQIVLPVDELSMTITASHNQRFVSVLHPQARVSMLPTHDPELWLQFWAEGDST